MWRVIVSLAPTFDSTWRCGNGAWKSEVTFSNSTGRVPPGTLRASCPVTSRVFASASNRVRLAGSAFIYGVMHRISCGDTTADSSDCLPEPKNERPLFAITDVPCWLRKEITLEGFRQTWDVATVFVRRTAGRR